MALRSILSETQKIELLKAVQLDDAALFETLIEEYMSKANCNTTVQYVWNLLFQIKCGKDNLITIPFICCQLGSIKILKCLITLGQKHCSNSLKQFLCQINIPQSNIFMFDYIISQNFYHILAPILSCKDMQNNKRCNKERRVWFFFHITLSIMYE